MNIKWIICIPLVLAGAFLSSCSSMGTQLNVARLQKVKDLERQNNNRQAVDLARKSNDTTYSKALEYMVDKNHSFYLTRKELDKVQSMNLPYLQPKLNQAYKMNDMYASRLKQNKALHQQYLASDAYKNRKTKYSYQAPPSYRAPTSYSGSSSQSSSLRSSGLAREASDRFNSAVNSAAEKERIRVRDSQWRN